jgi:tetraacyldisaccharide 4'-kinase
MTVFEFLYYLGCSIKKHSALKNQKKLPHKVISLGNITLGGTGKTPAAIALAREAQGRGFRPCILTRGYKGKAEGPCFVSKGEGPLLDEYQAGDEAILMAEKLKGVLIVKGSNKYEAGMFALNVFDHDHKPDLFILDDGFQHWALFRDKNILLIDSTNPFGNRRLIPLGPLREPIKEIKRADIVVITKRSAVSGQQSGEELVTEIRRYNTNAPVFLAEHRPLAFQTVKGERQKVFWILRHRESAIFQKNPFIS